MLVVTNLGTAVGMASSNISGKVASAGGKMDRPDLKRFFHEFFLTQTGDATQAYVNAADTWVKRDLLYPLSYL